MELAVLSCKRRKVGGGGVNSVYVRQSSHKLYIQYVWMAKKKKLYCRIVSRVLLSR